MTMEGEEPAVQFLGPRRHDAGFAGSSSLNGTVTFFCVSEARTGVFLQRAFRLRHDLGIVHAKLGDGWYLEKKGQDLFLLRCEGRHAKEAATLHLAPEGLHYPLVVKIEILPRKRGLDRKVGESQRLRHYPFSPPCKEEKQRLAAPSTAFFGPGREWDLPSASACAPSASASDSIPSPWDYPWHLGMAPWHLGTAARLNRLFCHGIDTEDSFVQTLPRFLLDVQSGDRLLCMKDMEDVLNPSYRDFREHGMTGPDWGRQEILRATLCLEYLGILRGCQTRESGDAKRWMKPHDISDAPYTPACFEEDMGGWYLPGCFYFCGHDVVSFPGVSVTEMHRMTYYAHVPWGSKQVESLWAFQSVFFLWCVDFPSLLTPTCPVPRSLCPGPQPSLEIFTADMPAPRWRAKGTIETCCGGSLKNRAVICTKAMSRREPVPPELRRRFRTAAGTIAADGSVSSAWRALCCEPCSAWRGEFVLCPGGGCRPMAWRDMYLVGWFPAYEIEGTPFDVSWYAFLPSQGTPAVELVQCRYGLFPLLPGLPGFH